MAKKKKKTNIKTNTKVITKNEIDKLLEDNNLKDKETKTPKRTERNKTLYEKENIKEEVEILNSESDEEILDTEIITNDQEISEMDMSFTSKTNNCSKYLVIIIILIVCFLGFIVFHYTTFNHHKIKVVTKIKEVEKVPDNYLFLGDSITDFYDLDKYYSDLPVVNSGISGNTTEDILNDIKKRAYQYNPSKVFLLIGTNDLTHDMSNDEIISNIEKIIEDIKENRPKAEIYLESIYPVNYELSPKMVSVRKNDDIKEINKELKKYCKKNKITYIDMYDLLKDDDDNFSDKYTNDGLHPNDEGYEVITKEIKKYLD